MIAVVASDYSWTTTVGQRAVRNCLPSFEAGPHHFPPKPIFVTTNSQPAAVSEFRDPEIRGGDWNLDTQKWRMGSRFFHLSFFVALGTKFSSLARPKHLDPISA